jgi:acyl-CoA dehydrogenase
MSSDSARAAAAGLCPAERYLRDARMLTIPDGTTQVHKLVIGRELTGISAFT